MDRPVNGFTAALRKNTHVCVKSRSESHPGLGNFCAPSPVRSYRQDIYNTVNISGKHGTQIAHFVRWVCIYG